MAGITMAGNQARMPRGGWGRGPSAMYNQSEEVADTGRPPSPYGGMTPGSGGGMAQAAAQGQGQNQLTPGGGETHLPVANTIPIVKPLSPQEIRTYKSRTEDNAAAAAFLQSGGTAGGTSALQAGYLARLKAQDQVRNAQMYGDPHFHLREAITQSADQRANQMGAAEAGNIDARTNTLIPSEAGLNNAKSNLTNRQAEGAVPIPGTQPKTNPAVDTARGQLTASQANLNNSRAANMMTPYEREEAARAKSEQGISAITAKNASMAQTRKEKEAEAAGNKSISALRKMDAAITLDDPIKAKQELRKLLALNPDVEPSPQVQKWMKDNGITRGMMAQGTGAGMAAEGYDFMRSLVPAQ